MSLSGPKKASSKSKISQQSAMRRARILAWTHIGLGLFGVVLYALSLLFGETTTPGEDTLYLIVYGLIALLGYFLLQRRLIAFRIFRVVCWIDVVLGGLVLLTMLSAIPFILQVFAATGLGSLFATVIVIGTLLYLASPIVSLILLIMTNPPEVKKLFR